MFQTTDSHQANRLPRGSYVWTVIELFYAAISIYRFNFHQTDTDTDMIKTNRY